MLGEASTGGNTDMAGSRELRFSIVIPAHNEEEYIASTLEHASSLSYPTESFEVIVVENGSSDRTLDVARQFEGRNVRVFTSDTAGVSAAKNFGIDRLSPHSDWVVFLDADTILKPNFLLDLDAQLRASRKTLSVNTTKVLPLGGGRHARAWFACYDLLHRLGGSYAIQIAKRWLFPELRFDEHLIIGEYLLLIKQARKLGKFFYVPTDTVYTSTRRFDTVGYWRLYFQWASFEILPRRLQKRRGYKVIR